MGHLRCSAEIQDIPNGQLRSRADAGGALCWCRKDHSYLLQAFRFLVSNDFLQHVATRPLVFPNVEPVVKAPTAGVPDCNSLVDCLKVCLGPGTDPSDEALFVRNILIQVGNLASLLHLGWFKKTPTVVI